MKESGRRRGFKSWFVEPYIQVKLGLVFLVLNFLFAGSILGIFGFYVWDIYQTMAVYFQLNHEQSFEILQKFQTPVFVGILLVIVFVCLSILVAVRYTHRIYGPLVSIHRYLDDFLQGVNQPPLVLRESDQLQELAEKLNKVVSVQKSDEVATGLGDLSAYLDDLLAGLSPRPIASIENERIAGLAARIEKLGRLVHGPKAPL